MWTINNNEARIIRDVIGVDRKKLLITISEDKCYNVYNKKSIKLFTWAINSN